MKKLVLTPYNIFTLFDSRAHYYFECVKGVNPPHKELELNVKSINETSDIDEFP